MANTAYGQDEIYGGNRCAVCEKPTKGWQGRVPMYLCGGCWTDWSAALIKGQPWITALVNAEKQRRKARKRDFERGAVPSFVELDAVANLSCAPIYAPKQ